MLASPAATTSPRCETKSVVVFRPMRVGASARWRGLPARAKLWGRGDGMTESREEDA